MGLEKLDGKDLPTVRPKIVSFQPVVLPTPMGTVAITVYGLSDDSKMYMWSTQEQTWVPG